MTRKRPQVGAIYYEKYEDGTDEWFICVDDDPRWPGHPVLICVLSTYESSGKSGKSTRVGDAYSVGESNVTLPAESWPDDVCAAVAKWRLTR